MKFTYSGIDFLSVDLKEKKITVVGGVDPVVVVNKLRKNWPTEILTVGPAKEGEKKEKKPQDDKKPGEGKKNPDGEIDAEFFRNYNAYYNPYLTQHYDVHSAEENPNACVIC